MRPLFLALFTATSITSVFAEDKDDGFAEGGRPPLKGEKLDEIDFSSISEGPGILPLPSGPDKSSGAARESQQAIIMIVGFCEPSPNVI